MFRSNASCNYLAHGLGLEVSCHHAASATACHGLRCWESPASAVPDSSAKGCCPSLYCFCKNWSQDNPMSPVFWRASPIFNDGNLSKRGYYSVSPRIMHGQRDSLSYHRWSSKDVLLVSAMGMENGQDPPNRDANTPLIPATMGSEVHTTEMLPWANPHVCPCTHCLWGATSPGRALAWADLGLLGHPRRTAGSCPIWLSASQHRFCYNLIRDICHRVLKAWRLVVVLILTWAWTSHLIPHVMLLSKMCAGYVAFLHMW